MPNSSSHLTLVPPLPSATPCACCGEAHVCAERSPACRGPLRGYYTVQGRRIHLCVAHDPARTAAGRPHAGPAPA